MITVGVAIPSIPRRHRMAVEAVGSVLTQSHAVDQVLLEVDHRRSGAAQTRNRAWRALDTEWVCFLDDDDLLYPQHVAHLVAHAAATGADLVYPWFDVQMAPTDTREPFDFLFIGGVSAEGHPFDAEAIDTLLTVANFIPVTVLVRRELLVEVDGFPQPGSERWPHDANEDWGCWRDMLATGAVFAHLPERTWRWRWHADHTMGRPG